MSDPQPRHFTTWLDLVDHWQTVIAGLIALIAAIITVRVTLRVERGKADRELDALRRSIAVELRQHIATALSAYDGLNRLGSTPNPEITARTVKRASRMVAPIIYPANAGKIGLLGAEATDVMIAYDHLEDARDRATRLVTPSTGDDVTGIPVKEMAAAFLEACEYARGVLPRLRTGDPSLDAQDEALNQKIDDALAAQRSAFAARGA
jgi:hypothetical protein